MCTLNDEWNNFLNNENSENSENSENIVNHKITNKDNNPVLCDNIPKSSDIYISTKTKIVYLNNSINLKEVFWKVPLINYETPETGIIKKQMKFNSDSVEELHYIENQLKKTSLYVNSYILTHIDSINSNKKTFKDVRKISIGLSKKDIASSRSKQKSAFYNCFVLILRLKIKDTFKEIHVKVFNTGKLEIPGIQTDALLIETLQYVITVLKPYTSYNLDYNKNTFDTVLINSNFNCGYEINREELYKILINKYNINACYDPCSYPGIQCKYSIQTQNETTTISYMIFRTGSILIVGKCDEEQLYQAYHYLKNILEVEFSTINQGIIDFELIQSNKQKMKNKKSRKTTIYITHNAT
jgi:TATA-box binding protein (TBP) (component of TFIID and TFIIIB)